MEYHNNKMCVRRDELVKYQGEEIIPISGNDYTNWLKRGYIVIERRGCYGKDAMYSFDSLQPEVQKAIKEKFGDPREKAKNKPFVNSIMPDSEARLFFKTYLLPNGRHLSDIKQEFYCNDAALLNAIAKVKSEMMIARAAKGKTTVAAGFWERALAAVKITEVVQLWPNNISKLNSVRSVERKFKAYKKNSYISLVSGKEANQNAIKIDDEAGEWLIARYATPVNRVTLAQLFVAYNEVAVENDWKEIQSVEVLRNYLKREDIKPLWYGMRHGELKYKERYTRHHRTLMPTKRDALWYSDGTKLNYYFLNKDGKVATCQVYEVIDVYSEKFLGYHISKTEDFEAQYHAFKMAIQTAGHKPYEIRYDNQGGHKKLAASDFLHNLSRLSIPTQPYNGKSKTIESAFGRFQQQFLSKDWFFTGQNITAKKEESRANMEFVLANKHKLPLYNEIEDIYKKRRNEWNESRHHVTNESRNQTYYNSVNEETEKVEIWDMIDLFWVTTKEPSTYRGSGIEIQVKLQKYAYEVLTSDGEPDSSFMLENIEKRFFVKYDPANMDMIALYDKDSNDNLRFVKFAQPYIQIHRAIQEQEFGEAKFIKSQEMANKAQRINQQEQIESLMEKHGFHPGQHGLNMPKVKGISKKQRKTIEVSDIGGYNKLLSNLIAELEGDDKDIYDVI